MEYTPLTMTDPLPIYLTRAEESLRGMENEFAQGCYNHAANRCYYACFQAAVGALHHAGMAPRGGRSDWGPAFVQAEFVGRCTSFRCARVRLCRPHEALGWQHRWQGTSTRATCRASW